jgi:hypothetical protein
MSMWYLGMWYVSILPNDLSSSNLFLGTTIDFKVFMHFFSSLKEDAPKLDIDVIPSYVMSLTLVIFKICNMISMNFLMDWVYANSFIS